MVALNAGQDNKQESSIHPVHFLARKGESVDKYAEFLSEGVQSKGYSSNPRNLFDDSNKQDKKWFDITMSYLARAR